MDASQGRWNPHSKNCWDYPLRAEFSLWLAAALPRPLHGYVRLTDDIDLLVSAEANNLERLLNALKHFGEGYASELHQSDFDDSEGSVRIVEETECCHADLDTWITGRRYEHVVWDAEIFNLNGLEVRHDQKAALIAWRENSIRDKDRFDALALKKLQADSNDFD